MTVKREDLMAAAAAGLLPLSQVDAMLIFLRTRDALERRQQDEAGGDAQAAGHRARRMIACALSYLLAILLLGSAAHSAGLSLRPFRVVGPADAMLIIGAGALFALGSLWLAIRLERRREGAAVQVLSASWLALACVTGFVAWQLGLIRLPF